MLMTLVVTLLCPGSVVDVADSHLNPDSPLCVSSPPGAEPEKVVYLGDSVREQQLGSGEVREQGKTKRCLIWQVTFVATGPYLWGGEHTSVVPAGREGAGACVSPLAPSELAGCSQED